MVGLMARDRNLRVVNMTNVKRAMKPNSLEQNHLWTKKMTHKDVVKETLLQMIMFFVTMNMHVCVTL